MLKKKKLFIILVGLLIIFLGYFFSSLLSFFYGIYAINENINILGDILHPSPLIIGIRILENAIFFLCCFLAGLYIGMRAGKKNWRICVVVSLCWILPIILYNLFIVIGYSFFLATINPRITYGIMYHDLQQAFIGTAWSHIRNISLYLIVPTVIIGGLLGERRKSKTAR